MSTSGKKKGKFITFEGIEGSGKSTQIRRLSKVLKTKNVRALFTREPGGTELGDELRALLLQSRDTPISPLTELFMMEAARAQHVDSVIRPGLDAHDLVVCDRYADASLAYQGGGRGIDLGFIDNLNRAATGNLIPDRTFLFDLDVDLSLNRAMERISREEGKPEDRFENEKRSFHEKVRRTYLELAKKNRERFVVIDGGLPEDEIHGKLIVEVDRLLGER